MVERFQDKFDFIIITRDHDGDGIPYHTVKINQWNELDKSKVFYLPRKQSKLSRLRKLIREVKPQLIYINSVFSTLSIYLLILKKFNLINEIPVVLAPEGELSDGALELKARKKRVFMKFARSLGLYEDIIWKVTAEPEKFETERFKGSGGSILVAPNMPSKSIFEEYRQDLKPKKNVGHAKMLFLSRYMRKKNFKWLLENLQGIEGDLEFDIIGPLEDKDYWLETQEIISKLPENIKVNYKGFILHEEVLETVFNYHFFILPTVGENFGHVFIEALAAGCPLLISDRTPWVGLESQQIGWDLPLENPKLWVEKINDCINLDDDSYSQLSRNARLFALDWLNNPAIEQDTLKVLQFGLDIG